MGAIPNPPQLRTDIRDIVINPGDRAVFVGRTGSGKTWAAGRYLVPVSKKQPLLVIDPKGMFDWPESDPNSPSYNGREHPPIAESPEIVEYYAQSHPIVYYRPEIENDVVEETNDMLRAIYRSGDVAVYIDELYGVGDGGNKFPKFLNSVYTRGRQKLVTVLSCVQRPAWVPRYTLSENTHVFCFDLDLSDDRGTMAGIIGDRAKVSPIEACGEENSFWYHNTKLPRSKQPIRPYKIIG